MATKEEVQELVERVLNIEHEIKMLQDDKKELLESYKDKLDIKVFNAALRVARIKAKLKDTSDASFDNVLRDIEDKICV